MEQAPIAAGPLEASVRAEHPAGTHLFSWKHGKRVLAKPSKMLPGTKCFVRYDSVGARSLWLPVEDFVISASNVEVTGAGTASG